MNKLFIRYILLMITIVTTSNHAWGYTNADCDMAKDLASTGMVYKENDCRNYNLDRTIYRQEVAALALRVAEKCGIISDIPELRDYKCDNIFYDITSNSPNTWICRSAEILANNDIITTSRKDAYGRPYFQPMQDITKAEALSIVMNSAGLSYQGERYDDWRFTGTGAVTWQKPVMQYAEDHDIISSISSFRPNTVAYRKEVFYYTQKTIEHCGDGNNYNNNNSNNYNDSFSITSDKSTLDTNNWIDITIRSKDGTSTNSSYRGTVEFEVYYKQNNSSSWTKTTSSSYYEINSDFRNGYTFTSSNRGQKTFSNFIRFKKTGYQYKVVVIDEDNSNIEGYKIFSVGGNNDNSDSDNFYINTDYSSTNVNNWTNLTVQARNGSYTDASYRGTVEFEVYYKQNNSSSWTKTTSSSYYEINSDFRNGYTFTSSNRGQKTFSNFIRFKKTGYQYKVVVIDEDNSNIEGYKIFSVGGNNDNDNNSDCDYGEYESNGNCYACSSRPSNSYYEESGSCNWSCNSGYVKRNNSCEWGEQTCGVGQYSSDNSCYNCTIKPSLGYYTDYGTCDWSCNSGYYRYENTCISGTSTCGVGQIASGNGCQTCSTAPTNSYYTTSGSCSWTCNTNYYASGNQCVPYTQNCGVGQQLSGNACTNCNNKPINALYTQNGTCEWACDYGYTRDGNSCIMTQNYSPTWYQGTWSSCSTSCGGGVQTRIVECRSNIGYVVNNWQCAGTTPPSTQSCNTQACESYNWSWGTWGTCQNNSQSRSVVCKDNNNNTVYDGYCNSTKPVTTQTCSSGEYYTYNWKQGNWGTCINNNRDRTVLCERNDGNIVSNSYCNSGTKPSTSESCSITTYSWSYSNDWGTCTNGTQSRSVVCKNSNNTTVSDGYCSGTKPNSTQSCSSWTYNWKLGNWGTCVNNNRDRTVLCERNDGNIVSNSYCNAGTRPSTSESCVSYTYSWDMGNWGTCNNGNQTRSATCKRNDGTVVSQSYCTISKPSTNQNCATYTWYRGNANTCGQTCGSKRVVVCQNTNGKTVADSNCGTSKPGHICSRELAWVDANGTKSCNTICNNRNSCWVEDPKAQACASGERMPTWGSFNYIFGKINKPTALGGYYIYERENQYYCYAEGQVRDYDKTDKVVGCLCQ